MRLANEDQAAGWDGPDGEHWTRYEEQYNASTARHGARLLEAAPIREDSAVLDIGCGCGESTRAAARRAGRGRVLGIDLSARMLERAREHSRAEALTNVQFEQADAQVYPFPPGAFDVVISRFGAMFFADPVAAFRNIGCAMAPDASVVVLAWQELRKNPWLTDLRQALVDNAELPLPPPGEPGPFGLADPGEVRRMLSVAGFELIDFTDVREPMFFGPTADQALAFVREMALTRRLLAEVDPRTGERLIARLRDLLAARETKSGVCLESAAWIITARRPR